MRVSCTAGVALLTAALSFAGAGLAGGHEGEENGGGGDNSRRCVFRVHNQVVLSVGDCEGSGPYRSIPVVTNTRTNVCVSSTDFERTERDCEGGLLETVDRVPAVVEVDFSERPECENGSPMQVCGPVEGCWTVNTHRGGYAILLDVRPAGFEICDDAGCYTATVTVTVSAQPFEDCGEDPGDDDDGDDDDNGHGNNGVGNGDDPPPPGNDGENDDDGAGPGNPGGQGNGNP